MANVPKQATVDKDFLNDSIKMVEILEKMLIDKRKFLRSEINELASYLEKYERVNSPIIDGITEVYTGLLLDLHGPLSEEDVQQMVTHYLSKLGEIKDKIKNDKAVGTSPSRGWFF